MNKPGVLFNLKEWLTIPDAARHLSTIFDESLTEADILRLGLDGHLKLSVYFVNDLSPRTEVNIRVSNNFFLPSQKKRDTIIKY